MDLIHTLVENLHLPAEKIRNTVTLLQADNTVPFIARYRKEMTGGLDEEQIHTIKTELQRLENLEERRQTVLESITQQGKLTDALKDQILAAATLTTLEDLYQPFRPKRRTRAMIAREKGLEPLANLIIGQPVSTVSLQALITPFINEAVPDQHSAIAGACDIIAEMVSENAIIRRQVREKGFAFGQFISEKNKNQEDLRNVYALYHQFSQRIKHLQPHQILAMNRGEREQILKISIDFAEQDWCGAVQSQFPTDRKSVFFEALSDAIEDAAKRLLLPAIERDIRRTLTENAEAHAIQVFAKNLYGLLTQPPLADQVVLGIDPGFRTGSKVAVVDPTGKLLETATIYPHPPQNRKNEAYGILKTLIEQYNVTLIVIGNGTASRETAAFVAEMTKNNAKLSYLITSEAGASVYSASVIARKEFPHLDVSIRGAISIARRVQDPLAELVKIDPKAIGVGLYQHDVNQTQLSLSLDQVVETVVNRVGVEVNTASAPLLTYVAGIGPSLAEKIVQYREEHGPFRDRSALKAVPGMGPKSFEQSAGFLRIRDGINPLDATAIHPESYPVAEQLLISIQRAYPDYGSNRQSSILMFKEETNLTVLAESLNTGVPTLEDIFDELARPGRDPREDIPKPILRDDVLSMDDLSRV
jgi:protein Tex